MPLTRKEAVKHITKFHRHHIPPQGYKFAIGLMDCDQLVGCVTVGRPVCRHYDRFTAEATRCCVIEGVKNGCSMLYGAAWRAARAMGYRRIITYTLASESGTSLRASGYRVLHEVKAQSWDKPKRPRIDKHPVVDKLCWIQGHAPTRAIEEAGR